MGNLQTGMALDTCVINGCSKLARGRDGNLRRSAHSFQGASNTYETALTACPSGDLLINKQISEGGGLFRWCDQNKAKTR
jgi:hypothetical protein